MNILKINKYNELNEIDKYYLKISIIMFIIFSLILFFFIGYIYGINHEQNRIVEIIKNYDCFHK